MDLPRVIQVARGALVEDRIAGIGTTPGAYKAKEKHDLKGAYLAPGLIDGHVHIESAMVSVPEFARAVVPHGTTTVIADPHEMANARGMRAIRYMLQAAKYTPLSVFVMASSCAPAGPHESAGAEITAYDLETLMQDKWVLGLAEVMNYAGLLAADEEGLAKLRAAGRRPVDGSPPGGRAPGPHRPLPPP